MSTHHFSAPPLSQQQETRRLVNTMRSHLIIRQMTESGRAVEYWFIAALAAVALVCGALAATI